MDSVAYWYKSEVYFWRTAGSLFWSVTCLPPVTLLVILLSHISLLQPWMGLADFFSVTCSLSFVLWMCILTAVLVAVAWSTTFVVVPDVPSTRLESYLNLLRPSRLLHLSASVAGGACVAWCFSHLVAQRFYSLTTVLTTADRELLVLNESHLFLVLGGSLAGVVYFCHFYLNHLNYLAFPVLQRDKYFRVRSEIVPLVKQSLRLVWRHLQIFYLGYWIFGGTYRSWVMGALNVDAISQTQPLDTVYVLLDFGLLWQMSLCSFFIVFTWSLTAVLHRVYHTQRLQIPLLSTFGAESKHNLTEALNSHTAPLLQHLAFLDLSHLSCCSAGRRQEVFSLSQPGGHPHTWRGVCGACLQVLDSLASQVHAAHLAALAALPVHTLPADKIFSFAGDMSVTQRNSSQSIALSSGVENLPLPPSAPVVPPAAKPSLASKLYAGLKNKPVLSYFLMELPDTRSRQLFASCQVHIWAIEAISHLSAASYEEDKYGVVQLTLSTILTTLVALHDNLEKYFKLQPMALRRSGKDGPPPPHVSLCHQLRDVLKTAIYRLINRFGKHLGDLHLKVDCSKRLRPFLDFKE